MGKEQSPREDLLGRYINFINSGIEYGLLRAFDLNPEKKIEDENIVYGDFVAIYFQEHNPEKRKVVTIAKKHTERELFDTILRTKLPKELKNWHSIIDSMTPSEKAESTARLSDKILGLPHAIIGFGRDKETEEKTTTMFAVVDISPIKALKEIKQIIFEEQQRRLSRKTPQN